jgi:acetolactate synthase I/II/III large subunit
MKIVAVETAAEAFIESLNANGVDYIFLNPGVDTVAIQEAVAKYKALGKRTPEIILNLHEFIAMNAAQGYFLIKRKPQVVLVHVDVGTMQVGCALHNAQQGQFGVVFCAGRTPSLFDGEKKGGRDTFVQWSQDQLDQNGIVRSYVKWDYDLHNKENIHYVVNRAFQIASSEPCGPVYLTLPRDLLMEPLAEAKIPDPAKYTAAASPQVDPNLLRKAAEWLAQAQNPLIITGYSGRHTETVAYLIELAETLGARVISHDFWMNFPNRHPLFSGNNPGPYFKDADVILIIDEDVPYVPVRAAPRPEAKIIQIDNDPLKQNIALWGFPVDLLLQGDSQKSLPDLTDLLRQAATAKQNALFKSRSREIEKENQDMQAKWREMALSKSQQKPISTEWLSYCIGEVVDEDTIILGETVTSADSVARQISRTKPGTIFNHPGSGLGWGLGAAIGAKLAAPDRTVVTLMGDGGFNFAQVTQALWTANVYHTPFLCVIFDNQCYNAVRMHHRDTFCKDSYLEKTLPALGVDFPSPIDYVAVARACHADGIVVEDPAALKPALMQALEQVRKGKVSIVDVRIQRPAPR